jgi:hypothetical protein
MSILTGRELEFLASLKINWRRLYCSELERLLKEGHNPGDARHDAYSIAPAIQTLERLHPSQAEKILAFAPEYRERDEDPECQAKGSQWFKRPSVRPRIVPT